MDTAALETYARKCRVLCTFEDHVLLHGFGAAVIDHLHTAGIHTPVERIGWPDEFIEHGKQDTLRELHGLTAGAAVAKILRHFA
jgi:1-deoxy-D-xylulose-5-phosphate synthase